MIRIFQYKLYPNNSQKRTLDRCLSTCCSVYNRALEQRIKAYKRRGENVSYLDQQALLTSQRSRIEHLRSCPLGFERDALRRVDRGMKAFFSRLKTGETPGFPRFRSRHRYNSLECLAVGIYVKADRIRIPSLGKIRCRGRMIAEGSQKGLRIICRANGWYAQIILDDGKQVANKIPVKSTIGVDLGLSSFAALSDGRKIANPRFGQESQRKVRALQRRVSRRLKGSRRRRKSVKALRRQHERIADQRRNFCHQLSTELVRKYDLIAVEDLNVNGMVRSRFAKSILDAAWSTFTSQLVVKAECAGRTVVKVDPHRTSQECPDCGATKPKTLFERTHSCSCGLICDRDVAAARVILARALVASGANRPSREPTADAQPVAARQVGPMKRENITARISTS